MTLAEFEQVMAGIALRNGHDRVAPTPSRDDFLDDLAAAYRAAGAATRH